MTITLFAQPYDISATGFYFESAEEYEAKAARAVNDYGQPVEEFEIQFIDGDEIDSALAKAWGLHQSNFAAFLDAVEDWDTHRKQLYIVAVGECGLDHARVADDPDFDGIGILPYSNLADYARDLVAEGVFGDIPKEIERYIDYDQIAFDLSMDCGDLVIAGEVVIYESR